jgi:hypothetical protein
VLSALSGDFRRIWAWRQLGLWNAGRATSHQSVFHQATLALVSEPHAIVPVLVELARRGRLESFLAGLSLESWQLLVASALESARSPLRAEDVLSAPEMEVPSVGGAETQASIAVTSTARHIGNRSLIYSQAKILLQRLGSSDRSHLSMIARGAAVLALIEVEPSVLGNSRGRAEAVVHAVAQTFRLQKDGIRTVTKVGIDL